jgi:predicted secreted protein
MTMRKLHTLLACCLVVLVPGMSIAEQEPITDQASFQVGVSRDVDNDRVVALLTVDAEDRDPAQLADRVNQTMGWALERARADTRVTVRTGGYQTYPVYDERKIVRWRARQELYLESGDVDRLSQLTGQLQERLQVQSLQFSVSEERRKEVEAGLVEQVLADFQQRAGLITRALGGKSYQLVEVAVQTGERDHPVPLRAEAMPMASRAAVTPPAMESGTSRVVVRASGSIHLVR